MIDCHEEFDQDPSELRRNYTKQDSVLLNLQRACEAALDMANRYIFHGAVVIDELCGELNIDVGYVVGSIVVG